MISYVIVIVIQAAINKMSIKQTGLEPTEYELDDMHRTQEYFKSSKKLFNWDWSSL